MNMESNQQEMTDEEFAKRLQEREILFEEYVSPSLNSIDLNKTSVNMNLLSLNDEDFKMATHLQDEEKVSR